MSGKLKSKFYKSVKNKKLNVFGVFLMLTFAFLVLTKLSKKYTDTITVSIDYINVPDNIIIALDSLPKVNVIVSSYGFNLLQYQFKEQSFKLDFAKDVYVKNNTYVWIAEKSKRKFKSQFGNSTEIVSFEADTVKFPFETLFVKKVPVILNSKIKYVSGYDILDRFNIKPDSINVIGPEADVSKIETIKTEILNLNEVNGDINTKVALKQPDMVKIKLSENQVNVTANVEKFTEGSLEIPITIINKPSDVVINYFPKEISVLYYVSLNNYKNVKPIDFKVECDYSEVMNTNKTYFIPKLVKSPKAIKSAKLKQNKVEFIVIK